MSISVPTSIGFNTATSGSSIVITTTAAIVAGNLVVVFINNSSATPRTVSSVSDGTNTYGLATSLSFTTNQIDTEIWYIANAAAVSSSASLTITFSGAVGSSINVAAYQVSGVKRTLPLDKTATNSGNSTTITATTSALSQTPEIIFGTSFLNVTATYTTPTGFTNLRTSPGIGSTSSAFDYQIVNSTSAVAYTPVWSSSNLISAVEVSFKSAPTGFNMPMLGM